MKMVVIPSELKLMRASGIAEVVRRLNAVFLIIVQVGHIPAYRQEIGHLECGLEVGAWKIETAPRPLEPRLVRSARREHCNDGGYNRLIVDMVVAGRQRSRAESCWAEKVLGIRDQDVVAQRDGALPNHTVNLRQTLIVIVRA